jgi:hypothetical protein
VPSFACLQFRKANSPREISLVYHRKFVRTRVSSHHPLLFGTSRKYRENHDFEKPAAINATQDGERPAIESDEGARAIAAPAQTTRSLPCEG